MNLAALVITLITSLNSQVHSANILFFHSIGTSSHRTAIWPLAARLADRGHNVTYISPIDFEKRVGSHPKIEEILPSKMTQLNKDFVADFDINIRLENRVDQWLQSVFMLGVDICEAFYDSPETQEWLSRPNLHYDLIMIDSSFGECGFGLVHRFKSKHIVFTPFLCGFVYDTFGVLPEAASVPDPFFTYKPNEMGVVDKIWNMLGPLLWRYNTLHYISLLEPVIRNKLNATDMPSLTDIEKNASLVFHNGYFVEEYPVSLPPMYVSFSGLRCDPNYHPKPLPKEMADFIDNANGFVYVSFGSAVDVGKMPDSLRNEFFDGFRSSKNLKFFWRWSGPIPEDTPDNVMLSSWFPQLDILAHKKIKGFVTQNGRVSTQEALCYKVPMIMIPVFADQDHNADRIVGFNASIKLNINKLSAEALSNALIQITTIPKYKEAMTKLSAIFLDRPISPLDNTVYWTEYVLRHDTSLMRPLGIEQTWYQRRLIDVYAFIFLVLLSVFVFCCAIFIVSIKVILKLYGRFIKQKTE